MLTENREAHEGEIQKRRHAGRGLGPFTSGHLTLIIVTLMILLGFPFAASAVTGNNIFVTDSTTGAHAKVNSLGQLNTTAIVSGAVTAPAAAPSALVALFPEQVFASEPTAGCGFYTPPKGKALVITRVDVYPYVPSAGDTLYVGLSASTSIHRVVGCTPNRPISYENFVVGNPPHMVDLGVGVGLASGHYLNASVGGAGSAELNIYGYLVPASSCTTGCW